MSDIKSFSQALPILAMHGMEPLLIGNKLWQVGMQTLDKGGVIKLARELAAKNPPAAGDAPFWQALSYGHPTAHFWRPIGGKWRSACGITSHKAPFGKREAGHCSRCAAADEAPPDEGPLTTIDGLLPASLQERARRYVAARQRSGEALLEAVAELAAARAEAKHGEWGVFLEAVGLDEGRARAQIRIHEEAEKDPDLAERIRTGWLSEAVARELLPAPPDVREALLARDEPPSRAEVRGAKRAPAPALELPPDLKARASRAGLNAWANPDGGYTTANASGAANYQDHATLHALAAWIDRRETDAGPKTVMGCEECEADATQRIKLDGIMTWVCDACAAKHRAKQADPVAAARNWLTTMQAQLLHSRDWDMFGKPEMQAAADHVAALLKELEA
jgi:ribosomal protein L37AE/L43A